MEPTAFSHPGDFPRRILLAVTGLSPQVVTETLYALAVRSEQKFVPTEVHLVTTLEGAERARLGLLHERTGWFHRLRRDYGLPEMRFDMGTVHVLKDAAGAPLADIRELADNERAADLITELVRQVTDDPTSALHVSIAGGRKTMGYYGGYAFRCSGVRRTGSPMCWSALRTSRTPSSSIRHRRATSSTPFLRTAAPTTLGMRR